MWAGLGYYSRGKRLHEGAQKVCVALMMTDLFLIYSVSVTECATIQQSKYMHYFT